MTLDPALRDHQAWLGYLQPDGLVVSPAALVDAQVFIDQGNLSQLQHRFLGFSPEVEIGEEITRTIADFPSFVREFLEWPDDCLFGPDEVRPIPDALTVPLPEFGETLAPTLVFRDPKPKNADNPW